jgi:hypothetical protein
MNQISLTILKKKGKEIRVEFSIGADLPFRHLLFGMPNKKRKTGLPSTKQSMVQPKELKRKKQNSPQHSQHAGSLPRRSPTTSTPIPDKVRNPADSRRTSPNDYAASVDTFCVTTATTGHSAHMACGRHHVT